jgi:hypothetical protein
MSKDLKPLSPIAIRFQHDLKINGKGERTQPSYVRMLRKFPEFLGRDPNSASEELRVTDLCGCLFLFQARMGRQDPMPVALATGLHPPYPPTSPGRGGKNA